jgi:hypothetical protein
MDYPELRTPSRSMGRTQRAITPTIRRRSGEAKSEVMTLTESNNVRGTSSSSRVI